MSTATLSPATAKKPITSVIAVAVEASATVVSV